jgi:hypothetical protein
LGEYEETTVLRNAQDTEKAQSVAVEEEKKSKPKVRKLTKKLLLINATEAIDEAPQIQIEPEKKTKKPRKQKEEKSKEEKPKKVTKILTINNDSDTDEE